MSKNEFTTSVALLRGVNVGGVKVLMQPLRELAQALKWTEVKTYIASGNLVFSAPGSSAELAEQLHQALKQEIGVDTPVKVLTATEMKAVLDSHPWSPQKGNQSHVYFCWDPPQIDELMYQDLKQGEEELQIIDGNVHFFAPNGLGQSQLADKLGKVVPGTVMTGRNLNTVRKLVEMTCLNTGE